MDLTELRDKIDAIDEEIVKLYEERMEISGSVAEYKIEHGKNVLDAEREKSKLSKLKSFTHNDFNALGVTELFEQIMSMSRKKQYALMTDRGMFGKTPFIPVDKLDTDNAKVVFQGINGAYSEAAMIAFFGENVDSHSVSTFREAMRSIDEGTADYAVLPIENSSSGIVNANYDLLTEFENYIVAEQMISIDNCLIVLPGVKESEIDTVYSHPQALMQCVPFLDDHPSWKQISYSNTAMSAAKIRDDGLRNQAAIAGERAAKAYGLEVLRRDINSSEGNSTRFIIVTNQKIFVKDAKKISLCFEIPHKSGSLYRILSHFIYNDLNMTKIESRPIPDRPWEYRFFIDFDGNLNDPSTKNALRGLREETRGLKILGNY
ncbi:MAG: prephenate dehydratase [Lachnospiraceae bacterium]|nr:prephenate dehydratase [Lachnospiraceae bacterium]MCR5024769.1 prephenate dehydratase [Lachnospiraceae bacterium]